MWARRGDHLPQHRLRMGQVVAQAILLEEARLIDGAGNLFPCLTTHGEDPCLRAAPPSAPPNPRSAPPSAFNPPKHPASEKKGVESFFHRAVVPVVHTGSVHTGVLGSAPRSSLGNTIRVRWVAYRSYLREGTQHGTQVVPDGEGLVRGLQRASKVTMTISGPESVRALLFPPPCLGVLRVSKDAHVGHNRHAGDAVLVELHGASCMGGEGRGGRFGQATTPLSKPCMATMCTEQYVQNTTM